MGNSGSVEVPGGGSEGYHVLRVQENSPGAKAGLQPFFDFIISINGVRLDKDDGTLKNILRHGVGKPLPITLFSCKTQSVRSVTIEPSDSWGGQGLLGISIKFCSFEVAKDNVWHILEVHPNSPAEIAGLKPFSDYIVGSDSILHESDDLYNLIENHNGSALKLYVYNCDEDSCREVIITPNSEWGGEGLVGCGIGYGYLHRIPVRAHPPEETHIKAYKPPSIPKHNIDTVAVAASPATVALSTTTHVSTSVASPTDIAGLIQETSNLNINPQVGVAISNTNISTSSIPQISGISSAPPHVSLPEISGISNIPPPVSLPNFFTSAPVNQISSASFPAPSPIPTTQFSNTGLPPVTHFATSPDSIPQFPNVPVMSTFNPINYSYTQPQQYLPEQRGDIANLSYPMASFATATVTQTFQPQPTQLIYDPTIAAKSAQQLLSGDLGNISHEGS
ncbi:hypothetical protein ABEB36_002632 [Hypothenemus hampei]|uniref:PDZ GRASP-type domain-containing protein n=1 Tax=Hypothenemus hampei TaxID=57062 RepID=A0ABD1F6K0_HYPHA